MTTVPALTHTHVGGSISVAARVVERTAAQLASTVPGIGAPGTQVLGVGRSADFADRPRLQVHIDGGRVNITIDCAVEYPRPLGPTADRIREVLIERLGELSGVPVGRVDVRIRRVVANLEARRTMS